MSLFRTPRMPKPLERWEFNRRATELRAKGEPLTLFNIQPELATWQRARRRQELLMIVGGVILAVAIAAVAGAIVGARH